VNRLKTEPTPSMILGSAIHARILEPDTFDNEFLVTEKLDLRYNVDKEKKKVYEASGKILLSPKDGELVESAYISVTSNPYAEQYLDGDIELSHYTEFMDVLVKVRPDIKGVDFIADIKTCQDNSPRAFRSDVFKYGYHIQAAFYSMVLGYPIESFKFIAFETNYPYTTEVYSLSEDLCEMGIQDMMLALDKWRQYKDTGEIKLYDLPRLDDGSILI
jgi:exodeoxyribonuclease VIII